MKKILFIVGSMRKQSFNRQLSEIVKEKLNGKAEIKELAYSDLPYMNQDIEFPTPEAVARVRTEVEEADGIWIFTPEYNYSYPGVLKNLLDWLSRPYKANDFASGTAVLDKKVTISGIGGKFATAGVREKLKELLGFMKMNVMEETNGFTVNPEAWQSNVLSLSEEGKVKLYDQADKFMKFIG